MHLISNAMKFRRLVGLVCALALLSAADGALAQPTQPPSRTPPNRTPQGFGTPYRQPNDSFQSQLRDERFRERLKLTEEQSRQMDQLRMDLFNSLRSGGSREEIPNILKEIDQKCVDLLTAEQLRIWKERQAELQLAAQEAAAAAVAREVEVFRMQSELKVLRMERSDTLQKLAEAVEQRYGKGQATLADATQASHRQFAAALECASNVEERFASHERLIANLRQLEKNARAIREAKGGPEDDVLEAKTARLKAEIDLLQEKVGTK